LLRQNSQPLEDMCPTSDRTSQLLEDIDVEEQGEEDEGFINLLAEETTVTNLLGLDDSFLIGPPVPPAAPLPSVQTPSAAPLPSVQTLPLHHCPVSRLLLLHHCPVSWLHQCPVSRVQTPSAAPLPCFQTPSTAPLPCFQAPPVPSVQTPSTAPLPCFQAPSAAPLPLPTLTNQQVATIVGLWQNLDQFDKDRVMYAARHQDRLLTALSCLYICHSII